MSPGHAIDHCRPENVSVFELQSDRRNICNFAIQLIECKYVKIIKVIQVIEF